MKAQFKILIVDDDQIFLETVGNILTAQGYVVFPAACGHDVYNALSDGQEFDLVLLDLGLPDLPGLDVLAKIREKYPQLHVYIITGEDKVTTAVKAMKIGADDYLVKPVKPEKLLALIERESERNVLLEQNAYFMAELAERFNIENIVGRSPAMHEVFAKVRLVADADTTVLITGESGTGKELIANHIHYFSHRRTGPLVTVACSNLAPTVFESELFGYKKGAFTGANETRKGRIELAQGGTLFLDEMGDIPLPFQSKLLRVLQNGEFERVGSCATLKSDFRLIAATNHKLENDVRNGLFREDLFYRIRVMEIELPPLRIREGDYALLLDHFIKIYSMKTGKRIVGSTAEVKTAFEAHDWPGNVRELKNVVERAFVYCQEKNIGIQHLPQYIHSPKRATSLDLSHLPTRNLAEVEKALVDLCMWEASGNKSKAAEMLGIMRSTLQGKLAKSTEIQTQSD